MNNYVIRAIAGPGAPVKYLSGKAGNAWLTSRMDAAFRYGDGIFAKLACEALNTNTTDERLRGFRFEAVPYDAALDDPVVTLVSPIEVTGEIVCHVPVHPEHAARIASPPHPRYTLEDIEDGATVVVITDPVTDEQVRIVAPYEAVLNMLLTALGECLVKDASEG